MADLGMIGEKIFKYLIKPNEANAECIAELSYPEFYET